MTLPPEDIGHGNAGYQFALSSPAEIEITSLEDPYTFESPADRTEFNVSHGPNTDRWKISLWNAGQDGDLIYALHNVRGGVSVEVRNADTGNRIVRAGVEELHHLVTGREGQWPQDFTVDGRGEFSFDYAHHTETPPSEVVSIVGEIEPIDWPAPGQLPAGDWR